MLLSRALLCAGLLMGAAAEAQEQPARPLPAATDAAAGKVIQTLVEQPVLDDEEAPHRILGEVRPDGEKFLVRVANMGRDAELAAVTWDVGQYTGFRPATGDQVGRFQRGPAQSVQGSAVQMRRDEIGIWIDSDHPRPQVGSLLPVCPAYWWWDVKTAPRPFADAQHELSMAFDMQVPTADRTGCAEVYVCAYFLLRDERSGQHFWLGASVFDLRGAMRFPDTVHFDDWEGGTQLPILFTALNGRSAWLHPGPGSQHFQDQPFSSYRRFEFRVGVSELRTAILAMKQRWPKLGDLSEEPRDYQLTHFNINPEVYAPFESRGRLGLALRAIRVLIVEAAQPLQSIQPASVPQS
jgi:hypothetical protein